MRRYSVWRARSGVHRVAVPTLICFHCRKHVGHLRYENVFRCLARRPYLADKPAPASVFTMRLLPWSICLCDALRVAGGRAPRAVPAHSLIESETRYALRKFSRNAPAARIVVFLLTDPRQISSAFRQGTEPPRSPKATVEAFANPRIAPGASSGTNAISRGSGVK
jgi:hypothetical protein